jgi:hypothetical protein
MRLSGHEVVAIGGMSAIANGGIGENGWRIQEHLWGAVSPIAHRFLSINATAREIWL